MSLSCCCVKNKVLVAKDRKRPIEKLLQQSREEMTEVQNGATEMEIVRSSKILG
jgi:hypothetical protein